ncbi:MAG: hypothetical protein NZ561_08035 [Phycisphaerae bacterium]|nr:hypothetical protein [Phycisphaerae bacterium]MDW8261613.1 flagellar hook capping FlgD N-terminal domain-containing protein [Phycisphaerales bacterium]
MSASAVTSIAAGGANPITSSRLKLKTEDFIRMMITQLQNQDPLEPAKNEQLLAQMSQIGQLQATDALQDALKTMVLQNNLSAASSLIGRMVQGVSSTGEQVEGLVNSVRVEGNDVVLELDNGHSVHLAKVTSIAPPRQTQGSVG